MINKTKTTREKRNRDLEQSISYRNLSDDSDYFNTSSDNLITPEGTTQNEKFKDDTRKVNYNKHVHEELRHQEDRMKHKSKNIREEDIHKNDVRKKFNKLIREDAKGDLIKHNAKVTRSDVKDAGDLKRNNAYFIPERLKDNLKNLREVGKNTGDFRTNIIKPIGDIIKNENRKYYREHMDAKDRGEGDNCVQKNSNENKKIEKIKSNDNKKIEDAKRLNRIKEIPSIKPFSDAISRKQIRDRYTVKKKYNLRENTVGKVANETNSDVGALLQNSSHQRDDGAAEEKRRNERPIDGGSTVKGESSAQSAQTEPKPGNKSSKKPPKDSHGQRKPIIKTVTVKNDNRVFKAVTFVEKKQHTPLFINMPTVYKKPVKNNDEHHSTSKPIESGASFANEPKEKHEKKVKVKNRFKTRQRILSPDLLTRGPKSPPTEVAKWAPSCITHHTKPYYEAWVDTTLASITKYDKKFFEKKDFAKAFKTAFIERLAKPDETVFDKIHDERYTGKIRVRRR